LAELGDDILLDESTLVEQINLYFCSNAQLVGRDFYSLSEESSLGTRWASIWSRWASMPILWWFLWFRMWW